MTRAGVIAATAGALLVVSLQLTKIGGWIGLLAALGVGTGALLALRRQRS